MRLAYRPPYEWDAILAFLGPRAIAGVERVHDGVYTRVIPGGTIEVTHDAPGHALILRATGPRRALAGVAARVRRLFDLDADPETISGALARAGGAIGRSARAQPGLRVAGAYDPFETAVRVLLGQQVSVAAATTLAGRLVVGGVFPSPAALAASDLSRVGLPGPRAAALRALASAVASGELVLERGAVLLGRPGIGPWTAGAIAMRLGDADAFPDGDLVLRRASGAATPGELRRISEAWRPYRAYAAMHLWRLAAAKT